MKINGLLIAAGFSKRMGEFKPLLNYNDNPFIVSITKKLLNVCETVTIVSGHKSTEIEDTIKFAFLEGTFFPRVKIVINSEYEKGMFTSLQAGLRTLNDSDWILYHFVDQPFHKEKFYKEFTAQRDDEFDWIQPVFDGKDGHPVMFRNTIFEKIISKPADYNLRLIRDDGITRKKRWDCGYPQILKDFDTPDDLKNFIK